MSRLGIIPQASRILFEAEHRLNPFYFGEQDRSPFAV